MKPILLSLFLICALAACNKDTNSTATLNTSISYKVNDNLISIENADIQSAQYVTFFKQLPGTVITQTRYVMNAQKGANNVLVFVITTDSLQKKNYNFNNSSPDRLSFVMNYNGQVSGILNSGDLFDVTISEYNNSRVSGTFSAKFSPTTGAPGSTVITEGKFSNVQVIY